MAHNHTRDRLDLFGGYNGDDLFGIAVSLNRMPGWESFSAWHEHDDVTNTQEEMTNGGATQHAIRALPTSAAVVSLVSTSAEDGAGTLTGALTVLVRYLDENFEEQQEIVTLNGLTPATTTGTAMRIRQCLVLTVGSAGGPVGTVTISIGGDIQSRFVIGQNETREVGFTVPAGKQFVSTNASLQTSQGGKDISVDFAFEYRLSGSDVWYTIRSLELLNQSFINDVVGVAAFPSKTDFRVLITSSAANGPPAYLQVRGYMIDTNTIS